MAGAEGGVVSLTTDGPVQHFLSIKLLMVAVTAMVFTWSFGWLYMGATWDPISKLPNIQVAVMNCDGGIPPSVVSQLPPWFLETPIFESFFQPLATSLLEASVFNASSPAAQLVHWVSYVCKAMPDPQFRTWGPGCGPYTQACYEEAVTRVDNGDYWNVWFIPPNFSEGVLSWYTPSRVAYPYAQNINVSNIYGRGRSYTAYTFINAALIAVWNQIQAFVFGSVAAAAEVSHTLVDPYVYSQPLRLLSVDLHPVAFFGQHFATSVLCILLWLGSTFVVVIFNQHKAPAEIRKLTGGVVTSMDFFRSMGMKALCALLYTFVLSVLLTCILFSLGKGQGQWNFNPGYCMAFAWWLSFCNIAMNTTLLYALGPSQFSAVSGFLLVLQLTSSGAILSEELANPFFKIGRAFPFYYGVRGFKTIFFGGLENLMFANWLVIFGWNVLSITLAFSLVIFKLNSMSAMPAGQGSAEAIAF